MKIPYHQPVVNYSRPTLLRHGGFPASLAERIAGENRILYAEVHRNSLLVAGEMLESLLGLGLVIGILGASWLFTDWFTRRMYYRCRSCITLNAKRRSHCRNCGEPLP